MKYTAAISSDGTTQHWSRGYPGSISDIDCFIHTGLDKVLESGDSVYFDKGYMSCRETLCKRLPNLNVIMPTPKRYGGGSAFQFDMSHIEGSRGVSTVRIHVERLNRRVKAYRLTVNRFIPTSFRDVATFCAAFLSNYRSPLTAADWSKGDEDEG